MSAFPPGFSGSYDPADVTFLLTPVVVDFVDVAAKEALIQSGRKHYSEMLAREKSPSPEYMAVFHQAFAANRDRVGRDVARLAKALAARGEGSEIVLVSLARAGTPIGVLLRRTLVALGRMAVHYSVSIIRDRGIDPLAMAAILARHDPASIVFVDGWTGKGAIGGELARAIAGDFPQLTSAPFCVLSDLAGVATLAAGDEDYVIPSAILNGIISGLISRTVLSDDLIAPGNFHGCMLLDDLADLDLSRWYVDEQMSDVRNHLPRARAADWGETDRARAAAISTAFVEVMMQRTGITDRNRVKPGIGEATRALLRRMPERLFLRDPQDGDVDHLVALASSKGIAVETLADLPYSACAIIKTLGDA
ncbi:hypothetical protein CKO38_11250 [Rhodospirillum rubrum]|uniref:cysteine protease StiP family protein n=1 Tax=Rhodospirillum rubrum TaxID=1085 RepID=UPI001903EF40|nr:cysteine protease StiP family protein [Rhodospirillum rubrum]MBK1664619.1 hypothetical protein [Rhodospirillum rubrum]MBK1677230.1 hypothetical protein [Rhodospirillum rubrum]